MSVYLSIFRIRAAESLQYRLAALSGAAVNIIWTLIEITVLIVFYEYADNRFNFTLTLHQAIAYTWVKELIFSMLIFNIDDDIRQKITDGGIGTELCRPLDLYWHWYAKTAAGRVGTMVFRAGMVLIAGILIQGRYGLPLPASFAGFCVFLVSACCAFFLLAAFGTLMCAVRLNITWGDGPMYILLLVSHVLGGGYLPLPLWPDFMQIFLLYQPFAGTVDIPARLYAGALMPSEALPLILIQLSWTAVFILLGRFVMAGRLKSVVIQGG
jgi:ABC-2 type transport system permease protein